MGKINFKDFCLRYSLVPLVIVLTSSIVGDNDYGNKYPYESGKHGMFFVLKV